LRRVREVRGDSRLKFGWTAVSLCYFDMRQILITLNITPLMSKIVAADLVDWVNGKTDDALKADKGTNIPRAKHEHLVDTSVENGQIKEILVKGLSL
jgi:hypothetical protein